MGGERRGDGEGTAVVTCSKVERRKGTSDTVA
jgi:hypothetical protein